MCTRIKIAKEIVGQYHSRDCATINPAEVSYIELDGNVLKDETQDKVKYETIYANSGGAFLPEWEHSDIKLLFILRESYILEDSFYNCKEPDRGGHKMNELYIEGRDWVWNFWENATYRNMVKITFFTYLVKNGEINEIINNDWNGGFKGIWGKKWDEACKIFIKHAAVISVNPFPALAFPSTRTDKSLLNKWLFIPEIKSMLQEEVKELNPKCVYGAFDLGSVSSYEQDGEQDILGRRVTSGGKYDKFTLAIDESDVKWIQGVHPSSRLSHKKMLQIAHIILSKEKNIFSEENIREQIL